MGIPSAEEKRNYKLNRQSDPPGTAKPRHAKKRRVKPFAVEERWTFSGQRSDWMLSKWYATVASRDEALRTLRRNNAHPDKVEYRIRDRDRYQTED